MLTFFMIMTIIAWTLVGIMTKVALDHVTSESFHKVFTHTRISAILLTVIMIFTSFN